VVHLGWALPDAARDGRLEDGAREACAHRLPLPGQLRWSLDRDAERDLLDSPKGPWKRIQAPDLWDNEHCGAAPGGGLWFPTGSGLYRIRPDAGTAERVARGAFKAAYEDSRGTVWSSMDEKICHAPAKALARGAADEAWDCVPAPNRDPTDFLEMDSGALWAATFDAGTWRLRGGRWEEIPASKELPSRWTARLSPRRAAASGSPGRGISCACASARTSPPGGRSWSGSGCGRACPPPARWTWSRPRTARSGSPRT
jgi:hypothetical protein